MGVKAAVQSSLDQNLALTFLNVESKSSLTVLDLALTVLNLDLTVANIHLTVDSNLETQKP